MTNSPNTTDVPMHDQMYRRDLHDGLVLRWSTIADVDGISELYSYVFRSKESDPPNHFLGFWVNDMMSGNHPNITANDFAVVEDTNTGKIVAATCLLRYQITYGGIPMGFGRPEIVASMPELRKRGLIRAIFELIHARSQALGDLVQGITGIPNYYRQFGYEYAVELEGSHSVYFADIPQLKEGEAELYLIRPATLDDIPDLQRFYGYEVAHQPLASVITAEYWHYIIADLSKESGIWTAPAIISRADGTAIGYLLNGLLRWNDSVSIWGLALAPGESYVKVMPSVLRWEQQRALTIDFRPFDAPTIANRIFFEIGSTHPACTALGKIAISRGRPYAWYMRVTNISAFIQHIAPVLEQRMANSIIAGYSGVTTINFYRGGLQLTFADGKLTEAAEWHRPAWTNADAGIPALVFLQLLFGYRSLSELREIYPDVTANDTASVLLDALFPQQHSLFLQLD